MIYRILLWMIGMTVPLAGTAQLPSCDELAVPEQKMETGFKDIKWKKRKRRSVYGSEKTVLNLHTQIAGAVSSEFTDQYDASGKALRLDVVFYNSTSQEEAQVVFNHLIRQFTSCTGTRYRMRADQQDEVVEGKALLRKSYFYFVVVHGDVPISITEREPGNWIIISLDRSPQDQDHWIVKITFEVLKSIR